MYIKQLMLGIIQGLQPHEEEELKEWLIYVLIADWDKWTQNDLDSLVDVAMRRAGRDLQGKEEI